MSRKLINDSERVALACSECTCTGTFTHDITLPSPLPGPSPPPPMVGVDRYDIVADPGKRSAPGFAVSGDGG
eukprot:2888518-Prymnesium_polylepis.1